MPIEKSPFMNPPQDEKNKFILDPVTGGDYSQQPEMEIVDDSVILEDMEITDDESGPYGEKEEYSDISSVEFGDNLAEHIDKEKLSKCGKDLLSLFEADLTSREEWEDSYIEGLKYLGISFEDRTEPWDGACGVFHPLLTEAVVRFQSQAILEIFPASGPVRTRIFGKATPEKMKQASRVEEEMNFILTETMPEYRWETEQLLFRLPLAGSALRKVYMDPIEQRPAAIMVPADDFIINYGASDLRTAERYTHRFKRSPNKLKRMQHEGIYRDIEVPEPSIEYTDIDEAHDDIHGLRPSAVEASDHTILEIHTEYHLGEAEHALPYVITLEKSSGEVLAIRRNWLEDDPAKRKVIHFAHYSYMPGMGFYGIGLVHLIGGLAKSATSIIRQLIDSGTLANLPAGYKTRGVRVTGGDEPLSPGEFRDIEVPSGDIGDNIFPLPFKEPSATLFNLLGTIVDEGRRIASIADLEVGDMNAQAPVGTTLALLERSLKVMSAVHARLHASLRSELRLIAGIIKDMPPEYSYDEENEFNRQEDFSSKVDIIPVSDPNAATLSQRVVKMQAVYQMYQVNPDLFDAPLLHRKMLESMEVKDGEELVPIPDELQPTDPVTENMAIITGRPVKAFLTQDHESHIQAHMSAIMDPKIMEMIGQSPKAAMVQGAMEAHMAEHIAYRYRQQIEEELGTTLPPPEEPMPPEVEVKLSKLVADAANRVFYRNKEEAQKKKNEATLQDPIVQIQLREIALSENQFKHKMEMDKLNLGEKKEARQLKGTLGAVDAAVELSIAEDKNVLDEMNTAANLTADLVREDYKKEE